MESVLTQTSNDFEYIIIDGASTDNSVEVIKEFLAIPEYATKITYWVSEPDKGIYNAMNKGILKATGEYCLFLNSGDWLVDGNVLDITLNNINSNGDVFYGNVIEVENNSQNLRDMPKNMSLSFLYRTTICHQSSLIKTITLKRKPYNENGFLSADWEWFFKSFVEGLIFVSIPITIAYYDKTGISSTNNDKCLRERELILQEYLPHTILNYINSNENSKTSTWNYYGKCLYQNKRIYTILLLCNQIIFKILRLLRVMKRIDN